MAKDSPNNNLFMIGLKKTKGRTAMKDTIQTFYYSRKKLGLYLLFNILLLALAVIFTLTVFPDYSAVYYFAIGSCLLSVIGALIVFLLPLPLAIISTESIKIDRADPLPWKSIRSVRKVRLGKGLLSKSILRLTPRSLGSYHLNLMQRISAKSEFGSFSIPLYAMTNTDAKKIEKTIREYFSKQNPSPKGRTKANRQTASSVVPQRHK